MPTKPEDSLPSGIGSTLYDCIAIFVSLADLTTDIIVLIQFYNLNRMNFYAISLFILILAQIAYCIAFTIRFSRSQDNLCIRFCTFLCCIPFAPFLSIVIYFASGESSKTNWLMTFMEDTLGLEVDGYHIDTAKSKYLLWLEIKLSVMARILIRSIHRHLLPFLGTMCYGQKIFITRK